MANYSKSSLKKKFVFLMIITLAVVSFTVLLVLRTIFMSSSLIPDKQFAKGFAEAHGEFVGEKYYP
ncbi:MAG: hypothetical protein J6V36_03880, partial [Clostridia bacterium]|nr:hypothetical protein [Clostridia bacterium]